MLQFQQLAAQRHLLRALFTADADISYGTLELRSDSLGLLQDVQLILLGFGIQTSRIDGGAVEFSGVLPDRQATEPGSRNSTALIAGNSL